MQINIEKRHLFLILAFLVGFLGVVFVIAYNPSISGGNPAVMGHSADELMVNVSGEIKGLQEAIDDGSFGGGMVAMGQGWIEDSGTIPLPNYPDGSPAQQSECGWITSLRDLEINSGAMSDAGRRGLNGIKNRLNSGNRDIDLEYRMSGYGWNHAISLERVNYLIVCSK
jgi:hypothetical protein